MGLEGKTALVTGASRGIGRAIAITLAAQGAAVIVNYNGSKEAADEVVSEIQAAGGTAVSYGCSVADPEAVESMMKDIFSQYKRLDILVNNAGITRDNLILKMKEEDFDAVLNTNLKGVFHTCRFAARQMLKQKAGCIVNISSISGVMGNAGQTNYAASKAGVIGFTKSLARELASREIRVNAVAPGFIETEMTDKLPSAAVEAGKSQIPFGRFGKAEEVAKAVCFLASEDASYITGQVLHVDGGMGM
ncbi:MAG: 3-oxoacyl-[acyl-carrier-protein] reductase [Lachnospiraceae bacterium]|nr:3-oxoacyl-[acyl-carrier-protein] reductase [Lachnospiraceae bacterium]